MVEALLHVIEIYGLWVVVNCVLLDQGGLPFSAYPPMIVTAAIAADMGKPLFPVLLVATLAALLADLLWYAAGNRFGEDKPGRAVDEGTVKSSGRSDKPDRQTEVNN